MYYVYMYYVELGFDFLKPVPDLFLTISVSVYNFKTFITFCLINLLDSEID